MKDYNAIWKGRVEAAVAQEAQARGVELVETPTVSLETPPDQAMGDLAVPFFPYAKLFRANPAAVAQAVCERLADQGDGTVEAAGPYLNIRLPRPSVAEQSIAAALEADERYGTNETLAGEAITIEFSSPNTNKPLHLGHLRNDALGESLSRILRACGADVRSVNLINDRGIHICKSMLAYQKFGNGETPESSGKKGDHLVGDYYVRYNEWAGEDETAEEQAREMLRAWEAGEPETVELWKKMNAWVFDGVKQTYEATGVHFDALYFESETYSSGKEEILRGVEEGVFYREEDGSVWVDLEPIGLDKKILLRSDGTSVYVTQDIGTVLARYADVPFDRMIYVVGSEQIYHFQVLFQVLKLLGYPWAAQLFHLSYGMVNLPEGKMKSREGTVVDADVLLAELGELARQEIVEKERESEIDDVEATAAAIALGALHYYLLQVSPSKDMVFNPRESLAFTGNTGPYLQYVCARINSILRKANESGRTASEGVDGAALASEAEWGLIRRIAAFPAVIKRAGADYSPSLIAGHLYEVAREFSSFYHDHPVLNAEHQSERGARLALCRAVLVVLRNGMRLLNIPYLSKM